MHSTVNNTVLEYLTASRFVRRCMRFNRLQPNRKCTNISSLFNPALNFKTEAFRITGEYGGTACLWRCGNNVFKEKLKNLNLDICIFTQGLNVKQVFYCYIVFFFSFYLRFISSLVTTSYFFILECKCTWKKYRVLPSLTSVIWVNLSFAMVLDNTTSPDYQLCVKTMYQAREKRNSRSAIA